MKVKTDELVAKRKTKEFSEAIKDLDILTEKKQGRGDWELSNFNV